MTEKLAIVGSRGFADRALVMDFVRRLPMDTEVVSGGAQGVDSWAELSARYRGMKVTVLYANWKQHGKSAGVIRNRKIVEYADRVVAFHDGASLGTALTIDLARRAGKPVEVVYA